MTAAVLQQAPDPLEPPQPAHRPLGRLERLGVQPGLQAQPHTVEALIGGWELLARRWVGQHRIVDPKAAQNHRQVGHAVHEFRSRCASQCQPSDRRGARELKQRHADHDPPPGITRLGLGDADLRKADLADANLQEAILAGTHLEGANLAGTNLRGAKAVAMTVWPNDFDPSTAGVILEYEPH